MFLEMVQSVKSSVTVSMFTVERAGEEELRQLEGRRRQPREIVEPARGRERRLHRRPLGSKRLSCESVPSSAGTTRATAEAARNTRTATIAKTRPQPRRNKIHLVIGTP